MTTTEFLAPIRALCVEYGMLPRDKRVLCALSGGRDSMALLHALESLQEIYGFTLCAAHFNHKLRGEESERDAAFVQGYCKSRTIPFLMGDGDVRRMAQERKLGIEDCARSMRYAFLEDAAGVLGASRIATAHHADDNLETMLLHLARGTGLRGLSGIAPLRGNIIRPLLNLPRAAIESYVAEHKIPFVEDSSNEDQSFARNRLRHEVLPVLRELNPNLSQSVASAARTLREDEAFLSAQAAALFRKAHRAEDGMLIEVSALSAAPRALSARVVRRMLEEVEAPMPSQVHLNGILAIASGSDPAASIHLPGGILVQRVYGDLLISWDWQHEPLKPLETKPLVLDGETQIGDWTVSCTKTICPAAAEPSANHCFLSVDAMGDAPVLRARQIGDQIALPGRRTKTLKKLMIEEKVPRRERERIPVLADGDSVLALAGFGAAHRYLAQKGAPSFELTFKQIENGKET